MTYPRLKFQNNISGKPQKRPRMRKKDWEPLIPQIMEMRNGDKKSKMTAKEIQKHFEEQQGFFVTGCVMRKMLREVAPLNNMKNRQQSEETQTKKLDKGKGKAQGPANDVEMQDISSETNNNEGIGATLPTVPNVGIVHEEVNIQESLDYITKEEIDEKKVIDLLRELRLDSNGRTSSRQTSNLLPEALEPGTNASNANHGDARHLEAIAERVTKEMSNGHLDIVTDQITGEKSSKFRSWLRNLFNDGLNSDKRKLSVKEHLHQSGFTMAKLLEIATDAKDYDVVDTGKSNYQRCYEEYIAESNDQDRQSAIRLHDMVNSLPSKNPESYTKCGWGFMFREITKGTKAHHAFQKHLLAKACSYWAGWRDLRSEMNEAVELLISAANLLSQLGSARRWCCLLYLANSWYLQGHMYDLTLLAVMVLLYTPKIPVDLWQSRARVFMVYILAQLLVEESLFDDANPLITRLLGAFRLNPNFKLLNFQYFSDTLEMTLSGILHERGLHIKSLAILYTSYRSAFRLRGKTDSVTLYSLEMFGERLYQIGKVDAAYMVYKYLFCVLTRGLERQKSFRQRYFVVTMNLGRICSLKDRQEQALKFYEKALPLMKFPKRILLPDSIPLIEIWISEALYKRGLVIYAQPLAESAVNRVERRYGTESMKQWITYEAYLNQLEVDALLAKGSRC